MEHASDTGVLGLVGESLSAVAFVQDYVEFHFDGRIVRALVRPTVRKHGDVYRFPEGGSRDALCSLIGRVMKHVDIRPDDALVLVFSDDDRIEISLRECDRTGPEAAHYVSGRNQPIEVW